MSEKTKGELPLEFTPEKWKGLPTPKIMELYQKRVLSLGSRYEQHPAELEALLSTSKDTGFSYDQIQRIYEGGENEFLKSPQVNISKFGMEEEFLYDDYTSTAHIQLWDHRLQRKYNRIAAYEMPLLTKFIKKYEPKDPKKSPLKFRFTSYMGEEHPAEKKVVVTFSPSNLGLTDNEKHKLCLLAGPRYDYQKDEVKMSSVLFEEPAQNMKYLSGLVDTLIHKAKDPELDRLLELKLDKRHIDSKANKRKFKHTKYQFPEEWKRPMDATKPYLNAVAQIAQEYDLAGTAKDYPFKGSS